MFDIESAIKNNDEPLAISLLPKKMLDGGICLQKAVQQEMLELVKKLLPLYDWRTINNSVALAYAAEQGNVDIVKEIMKHCDVFHNNNLALFKSIQNDHLEVTKLLIPHAKINEHEHSIYTCLSESVTHAPEYLDCIISYYKSNISSTNTALVKAVNVNNTSAVKRLLTIADPNFQNGQALRSAMHNDNQEMFDLLYEVSDVKQILLYMKKQQDNSTMLTARINADHIKQRLLQEVPSSKKSSLSRKI